MNPTELREWVALLGVGGAIGAVITLVLKAALDRKSDERKRRLDNEKESQDKRIETDRATYNQRITILIRENLAAYIRSGKWYTDEEDLRRLVLSVSQGTYEHFLDPVVNRAWECLVATSVELAAKRLAAGLDAADIFEYNRVRAEWEDAAKRSFGPLPATPGIPRPRETPRHYDPDANAA